VVSVNVEAAEDYRDPEKLREACERRIRRLLVQHGIHEGEERQCKIYAAHINDWTHDVYYEGLQQFRWPNMDHDEDYQRLVEMKEEWNDGDDTSDWVREYEVREEYEKELEQKQQEMRDRIVTSVYENTDLSQGEVGQFLPEDMRVKQQRVGQIVNGD
jgi:hypothetical protein